MRSAIAALGGAVVLAACSSPAPRLSRAVYEALASPDEGPQKRLARTVADVMRYLDEHGDDPAPGLRASHALMLWRRGDTEAARAVLAAERAAYPGAAAFVDALQHFLETGGGR